MKIMSPDYLHKIKLTLPKKKKNELLLVVRMYILL